MQTKSWQSKERRSLQAFLPKSVFSQAMQLIVRHLRCSGHRASAQTSQQSIMQWQRHSTPRQTRPVLWLTIQLLAKTVRGNTSLAKKLQGRLNPRLLTLCLSKRFQAKSQLMSVWAERRTSSTEACSKSQVRFDLYIVWNRDARGSRSTVRCQPCALCRLRFDAGKSCIVETVENLSGLRVLLALAIV